MVNFTALNNQNVNENNYIVILNLTNVTTKINDISQEKCLVHQNNKNQLVFLFDLVFLFNS